MFGNEQPAVEQSSQTRWIAIGASGLAHALVAALGIWLSMMPADGLLCRSRRLRVLDMIWCGLPRRAPAVVAAAVGIRRKWQPQRGRLAVIG